MPSLNIPASKKWSETEIERNICISPSERTLNGSVARRTVRYHQRTRRDGCPLTDKRGGTDQPAREGHDVTSTHTRTHAHTRTIGSSAHDIWAKTIIVRTDNQMMAHFNGPIGPWPVNLSTLANPVVVMGPVVFSGARTFRSLKTGGGGGMVKFYGNTFNTGFWLEYGKTSSNNRWCYKN